MILDGLEKELKQEILKKRRETGKKIKELKEKDEKLKELLEKTQKS